VILLAAMMTVSATPAEAINRGRAAMQAGDLPRAILIYRESRIAYPANSELKRDLSAARGLVDYSSDSMLPRDDMTDLRDRFNQLELFAFFSIFIALAAFGAAKYFTGRPGWARPIIFGGLVLSAIIAFVALIVECQNRQACATPFAVVRRPAILREGNGTSYPTRLDLPLSAGVEVVVKRHRGDWMQVELANGLTGWLRASDIYELRP
jgi:hypothetical protein